MILEIVILAMIAAFLGLRLYSVLGRRAEHEEEPAVRRVETPAMPQPAAARPAPSSAPEFPGLAPAIERPLREIAAADRSFDLIGFVQGAKGAYEMVLEAFWNGDRETLRELTDADVYAGFDSAISARTEAGETLDNTLIRIEEATIRSAELDGRIARIAVRFVADVAAVTRDKDGTVIAGSLDDAVESVDIWTFERDVSSASPAWVVAETDEG